MNLEAPIAIAATPNFLAGGGELGERMRALDWAATPLGPPGTWPQSLRTAVRIMLTSRQPIWIGWGEELTYLYNDPYKAIIGGKHPWALGRPTAEVWREIWGDIGPMLATAMRGDEGTYVEEQLLIMERNGYPEETYYTFSYSPIPNDEGGTGGIICANSDDTQRVIGERQLALLRDLSAGTAQARDWRQVCERAAAALASNPRDLPFAMIYMAEPEGRVLSLAGAAGIAAGHAAAPAEVPLGGSSPWPFAEALRHHEARLVPDLAARFGERLPAGAWGQAPAQAALLPVSAAGTTGRTGLLVVGLNPFRLFDDDYRRFLGLVAGQIAAALGNAEAYAEERRRAEALAELDRAKTAFFANVSHEFRTPLTLMLGPLEESLAEAGRLPAAERERVEVAHRNALRLLRLVNSLLDYSRVEAGRAQARYAPTDLAALTAELASSFRSLCERAGLRLTVDCPPLPAPVHVDREMWEKVVLNLLSNAFKFTFEGGIAVSLRPSADRAAAELVVRDTGTGIPAHELPWLFERFHRVEGARGRSFEGSGIGLALVRELVRLHGGEIRAESEPGRGSAFIVTIPFGTAHLPADHLGGEARAPVPAAMHAQAYVEEAGRWLPDEGDSAGEAGLDIPSPSSVLDDLAPPPAPAPRGTAGTGGTVLLADDNADMREYVRRLLVSRGYEVEAVADGEAALAAARRRRPDLVLSDVMMPRLDGFGLLRALRADPDLAETPVVLLSARSGEEARVEGLESGADDYLIKPFSARELLARVGANLSLARVRREAAEALREESHTLEVLNRTGAALAAELDLGRLVQLVTDAATELSGAEFGALFYKVIDENGEACSLYTLSGAPREAFSRFPQPRNTAVFGPTFRGEGILRSDDITRDPRYGRNAPYHGMPEGHLPVRSYLAVPVISRSGEVLGGLFFGHARTGVFTERSERVVAGIAAQAAVALDNARLYQAAQREIAARKAAEDNLRRLNELLEERVAERTQERDRIWKLSRDPFLIADLEGRWLSVSPAWTELLGWSEAELVGRTSEWMEHPEDRARTRAELARLAGSRTHRFENRFRARDGSWHWFSWATVPEAGLLYSVARDVTAEKEAEAALREAEERLRQSQKMEVVGQLTGGVAHDFNNLLTIITGNIDSLLRHLPQAEGMERLRRSAENAMKGAQRAASLTHRLLAFSRKQPLDPKPLEVNRLVGGMSDLLRRTLGETVAVETVQGGGLWRVEADPNQLESAILNLAVNARDAMPAGGKLTIETANAHLDAAYAAAHSEVAPGQYVVIAVTDTGIGMPKDILDRVFEPFFTTKEVGQGTGLGLSQVYGFVKQSGGHVKIYSEPGEGTTVKLYLPRLHGDALTDEELAAASLYLPEGGREETILLVEDDEDVRAYSAETLRELGYRVIEAQDGPTALRLIERLPRLDLLFTDVVLPEGMTGRQLADAARRLRPGLRVLFTTGYARNAIVHQGRLDPGVDLLSKPFTYAELAARVRDALDARN